MAPPVHSLSKSRKHAGLGAIPTMRGGERQPRREESVEKEEEKEGREEQLTVTHACSNDDAMVTPGPAIRSHPALRTTCGEKAVSGGRGGAPWPRAPLRAGRQRRRGLARGRPPNRPRRQTSVQQRA